MRASSNFSRLRALEFKRIFCLRLTWGAWRPSSTLEKVLHGGAIIFLVPYAWGHLSWARGLFVDWVGEGLAPLALPWLLWGLAGGIPMVIAIRAGWAWPERRTMGPTGAGRPIMDLLPLDSRQVLGAKLQGRLAALAVALAGSLALLAATRQWMLAAQLVERPPSLLDAWFVASVLVLPALFIASTSGADATRQFYEEVGRARGLLMLLGAGGAVAGGYSAGYLSWHEWWIANAAACAAAGILAVAAAQSLPRWRWMEAGLAAALTRAIGEPGAKDEEEPSWFTAWVRTAEESFFGAAMRGLGGHRSQTLLWLKSTVASAAGLALFGAVGSILLQVVVVLWNAVASSGSHGQLPASGLQLSEDAATVCLGIPILLFSAVIFTSSLLAWPETTRLGSQGTRERHLRRWFLGLRHTALLLPVQARRVWRERLVSLLLIAALMMIAGVASHLAAAGFSTVFGTGGLAGVRLYTYWGFAAALLVSLSCFALLPVLRLAHNTIALSAAGAAAGA